MRHDKTLERHDRWLRGNDDGDPGLIERVREQGRTITKIVPAIETLQSGDFRQSAVVDVLLRLAYAGLAVALGVVITKALG